jgi:sugar/nucleoside kinase (ribokinase family)
VIEVRKEKVMVAGHLCLDITPRFTASQKFDFDSAFSPGKLTNVEDAVLSTGGPVSNTGLALAKLGVDVMLNCKIGLDEFGNIIKRAVGEERAKAFKVVLPRGLTASICTIRDPMTHLAPMISTTIWSKIASCSTLAIPL